MDIPNWAALILLLLSLVACAFYSAAETAFACLNKYKFEVEAEDGRRSSSLILRLYEHFDTTLISVLIGNNAFAILISTTSTLLFLHWFSGVIDDSLVSVISSIAMAIVTFLFGDTIPKFIAKRRPNGVARFVVYPLAFFVILFYPISLLFRGITFLVRKIFKAEPEPEVATEDLQEEIEKKEDAGELESNESDILVNSLDFTETSVKEVLTPMKKMVMLDSDGLGSDSLLAFLKTCPYSRIPLYYKSRDKIVGILVVKNYLSAYFRNPKTAYLPFVQKPYFVTPSVKMDDLLDGFREHHTQIAIVRKEGKVLGMVTTEDVLEELVGSIDEDGNVEVEASL